LFEDLFLEAKLYLAINHLTLKFVKLKQLSKI